MYLKVLEYLRQKRKMAHKCSKMGPKMVKIARNEKKMFCKTLNEKHNLKPWQSFISKKSHKTCRMRHRSASISSHVAHLRLFLTFGRGSGRRAC